MSNLSLRCDAWLSGAQMGSNHEKNGGRKSRDTIPLTGLKMFASLGAVFGNVSERDPIVSRDFLGLRRILLSRAKAPCT